MAHFAELDQNNEVIRVIVVSNDKLVDDQGNESEERGIEFCKRLLGGNWIQTSYNDKIRRRYAAVGYIYDPKLDAFIPPKPFASWVLDKETCDWVAPKAAPNATDYYWDESITDWVVVSK